MNVLLVAAVAAVGSALAGQAEWPLREQIDFSSGFGDYRPGHFHFGVDLRTGGRIGRSIFAPAGGYVWKVKTSYTGYGKVLYIKGDDRKYYVFGHLSGFAGSVEEPLRAAQLSSRRYLQEIEFPQDSIRVKGGDFIGYTGQTGAGAPHLQFEIRSPDNVPLNPLKQGFSVEDDVAPVFSRVGFQMIDDTSLFENGRRKMFWEVTPTGQPGQYTLDTVLYFHRPFGILADCFDMMRSGGMKQAVYRLSLSIDNQPFYHVVFDSLDFDATGSVSLEYDYVEATEGRKHVRSLFKKVGNVYPGSRAMNRDRGVFGGRGSESYGLHQAELVAEDCNGNRSQLTFQFLWGPPGNIYTLDSVTTGSHDSTFFHFTAAVDPAVLKIDSVGVMLNRGDLWGPPTTGRVRSLGGGQLVCEIKAQQIDRALLRLFIFAHQDCIIRDNLFNGLEQEGKGLIEVEHVVLEDGLLIAIPTQNRYASETRIELYNGGRLVGIEYPTCYHMGLYLCFVPPKRDYAHIDYIAAAMSRDTSVAAVRGDSVDIAAVGFAEVEEVPVGQFLTLRLGRETFHEPRYIEVKEGSVLNLSRMRLNSPYYEILPEAFVCRQPFSMTLRLPYGNLLNDHSGLCWLDQEKDCWVWLDDSEFTNDTLTATSIGGGFFAAVLDNEPPRLKFLTVADGRSYDNRRPAVNFVIDDTLSGIGDDRDIIIEVDGNWLIPEYDPETGQVLSKPLEPLSPGRHHLGIRVTDRAGNLSEQYLNFTVKK